MFNPFSRTRTPGFNVRPQDDVRGFRLDPEVLDPEAEVPGSTSTKTACPDRVPSSALEVRFSRRRRR
jgi:hypothetical protein